MSDSDFSELLKSPYDQKSSEPEGLPWKLPVAAAIVGALVMAAFVLFAIVTGPTSEVDTTVTTVIAAPLVASESYPAGYAEVGDDVAMHADIVRSDSQSTMLYVSSATRGGVDVNETTPVEIASWTVRSSGTDPAMGHQAWDKGSLGGIAVEIGPVFDVDNATVIATLPGTIVEITDTVTLPADVPARLTDHRIVAEGAAVVIDLVEMGNGYGTMVWHLEEGIAAKVAVTVIFDGVEFPLSLVEPHAIPARFSGPTRPLTPLWNPHGETQLIRLGEPLTESNTPTGITVEFVVSVVTTAGEEIEVPIGAIVRN